MKTTTIAAVLLTGVLAVQAQERLPREEALKYAFIVSANLKEMLNTPIPTDPDVKRPVALRDGDYGGMVLPEAKLTAEKLAKAGTEVVPVGQLWLHKLAPLVGGQVALPSKLHKVHLSVGDQEGDAVCCALGVKKSGDEGLELLVFGKDKEPLAKAPMKAISATQENPIEMSSERQDDRGVIVLKLLGKYEARFDVTDPDQY